MTTDLPGASVRKEKDDAYLVSPLASRDRDDAVALMKHSLGDGSAAAKTDPYWTWKHEQSVFGASYVTGARAKDGMLASLRVMMRWLFSSPDGQQRIGVRPVDTATHSDHQRRGLFRRLTLSAINDLKSEGAAFVFNTPNGNSRPGYLKMGWSVVADWPLHGRPMNPLAMLRPLRSSAAAVEEWSAFAARHGDEISEVVRANESGRTQVGWRTVRTLDYLDWRYGQVPDLKYEVVSVWKRGQLAGFVLGRRARGFAGLPVFVVTEIFSAAPSRSTFTMLLMRTARSISTAYLLAHFADGTMERQALSRAGFVRIPKRGYVFTARTLDDEVTPDPLEQNSWDLTIGELEIF